MPSNIKNIDIWKDNPQKDRISNVVKIDFNFPCTWTILDIEDLLNILKFWIIGEEMKYPLDKDVGQHSGSLRGRWMLKRQIDALFDGESVEEINKWWKNDTIQDINELQGEPK